MPSINVSPPPDQDVLTVFLKALEALAEDGDMAADLGKLASTATETPDGWVIRFPTQYAYQCKACGRPDRTAKLEKAVSNVAGRQIKLTFEMEPDVKPPLRVDRKMKAETGVFAVNGGATPLTAADTHSLPPAPPKVKSPPPPPPKPKLPPSPTSPPVVPSLLKEYDRLNAFWKEAEKQLAAFHTPVFCQSVFWSYPDDYREPRYEICHSLAWEKSGKDWRLCYGEHCDNDMPDDVDWVPIVECTADIRVRAVKGFDSLRSKLTEASKKYLEEVREANETMAALLGKK